MIGLVCGTTCNNAVLVNCIKIEKGEDNEQWLNL